MNEALNEEAVREEGMLSTLAHSKNVEKRLSQRVFA